MDTATPRGSIVFIIMAAVGQMELEIKNERIADSVARRRADGKDLGGRRQALTYSQICNALRLIASGEPATEGARDLGMSRTALDRRIRELPSVTAWRVAGVSKRFGPGPGGGLLAEDCDAQWYLLVL